MTDELLPAIEIETGPVPDATVIWMHGLGDDGRGWSEVVPTLGLPASLRVRFLFPHAPVIPVSINQGFRMRAWYDVRAANITERADVEGVRRSQRQIDALIAREATPHGYWTIGSRVPCAMNTGTSRFAALASTASRSGATR